MTEQVLILGGGYAGVYAALAAARARGDANIGIMLVSAEPALVNRPRLYEPDPGPHLRYPLAPMLERAGASFRLGRVIRIDIGAHRVILADGAAGFYRTQVGRSVTFHRVDLGAFLANRDRR